MGTKYLIDSNGVIDYLRGSLPTSGMTFMNGVINDLPKVSIITKIEVLGFNTTAEAYKLLADFFDDALVLPLTDDVAAITIDLRKNYKIKLPDASIYFIRLRFRPFDYVFCPCTSLRPHLDS